MFNNSYFLTWSCQCSMNECVEPRQFDPVPSLAVVMCPINADPSIDAIVDLDACICNRQYALCASPESACVLTRDLPLSVGSRHLFSLQHLVPPLFQFVTDNVSNIIAVYRTHTVTVIKWLLCLFFCSLNLFCIEPEVACL